MRQSRFSRFTFAAVALSSVALATSSTRCVWALELSAASQKKAAPNSYDFYLRAGQALDRDFKGFDFPPFGNNTKNANSLAS